MLIFAELIPQDKLVLLTCDRQGIQNVCAPMRQSQNLGGQCYSTQPTALTLHHQIFTCLVLERYPVIPLCAWWGTTEFIYWMGVHAIVEMWKKSVEKDGQHLKKKYLHQCCSEILWNVHKCNLYIKCVSFYHCVEHHSCHLMSWQMQAFYAIKLQCLVQW